MWLIGFNHLINKYLKCLFVIDEALIWKLNVKKLVVLEALLDWNSIPTKTLVTKISRNLKLKFLFIWWLMLQTVITMNMINIGSTI